MLDSMIIIWLHIPKHFDSILEFVLLQLLSHVAASSQSTSGEAEKVVTVDQQKMETGDKEVSPSKAQKKKRKRKRKSRMIMLGPEAGHTEG